MNYRRMNPKDVEELVIKDIKYFEKQGFEANEIFDEIDREYGYHSHTVPIINAFEKCGYQIGK